MFITYRRTGGVFALMAFAAAAVAAAILGVLIAATVIVAAVAVGAVAFIARAVLPAASGSPAVRPSTPWPEETIETTAVTPARSSDDGDLVRLDSTKDRN